MWVSKQPEKYLLLDRLIHDFNNIYFHCGPPRDKEVVTPLISIRKTKVGRKVCSILLRMGKKTLKMIYK